MSESEDEVDILGDTPPASTINYSDPHGSSWLLDSSTAPSWCDNIQQDYGNIFDLSNNCLVSDDDQQPSTSNDIFTKWTDSEIQLLQEGIDIYALDFQKLSNFLGSKTLSEIKMFIESENISNLKSKSNSNHNIYKELLTESDIPASIEEVISMVTTAETTVEKNYKNSQSHLLPKENVKNSFISLNTNVSVEKEEKTHDSDELYIRNILRNNISSFNKKNSKGLTKILKTHSKTKLVGKEDICNYNSNLSLHKGKKPNTSYKKRLKNKIPKTKNVFDGTKLNAIQSSSMHLITGSGQMLPLSKGEQVIKIDKKNLSDAESDIEIEIDDDSNTVEFQTSENSVSAIQSNFENSANKTLEVEHSIIPDHLQNILENIKVPDIEYSIEGNNISELEKILNPEYFKGKSMKTPERYLIIRSHILRVWREIRPQYLTKTMARNGLKNCGDVNSIGKIHEVLEQIGAINFGCDQTSYIRPLTIFLNKFEISDIINSESEIKNFSNETVRQRKKKMIIDGDGGYTITHSKYGEFYEAVPEPKPSRPKKKPINLLYCKPFSNDVPAPYSVELALSTLILMDVHSYMSRAEVMGLLGGKFSIEENLISIKKYVPCESLENSGTHCDMCPVSQSRASDYISQIDLETVGWYHSHPLFPPQPSSQDILSQADLQVAFSSRPFVAIIVSPYWPPGRTYSQFKCFITRQSANNINMAYEFKINLYCDIDDETNLKCLLNQIENLNMLRNGSFAINLKTDKCRSTNLIYLQKCLSSISHHLNACNPKVQENYRLNILNGINKIFNVD